MAKVTIGVGEDARDITIEEFRGRKATEIIERLRAIAEGTPQILQAWNDSQNVTLGRVDARYEFRPEPIYDAEPVMDDDGGQKVDPATGEPIYRRVVRTDDTGAVMLGPDPLGHLTEADWQGQKHTISVPRRRTMSERVASVFPDAMRLAKDEIIRLLALVAMPNADVKKFGRQGTKALDDELKARGDDLLDDALADQLVELAVVGGEVIDVQFSTKLTQLGDRLPNMLRLFGIKLPKSPTQEPAETAPEVERSTSSATSSSDSPTPSDGTSEPPSTEPVGASSSPSTADS